MTKIYLRTIGTGDQYGVDSISMNAVVFDSDLNIGDKFVAAFYTFSSGKPEKKDILVCVKDRYVDGYVVERVDIVGHREEQIDEIIND